MPNPDEREYHMARFYHSQQLSRQLAAIVTLSRLLNSSHQLEQQLILILKEIQRVLDVEYAVFYLLNEDQSEICSYFVWDNSIKQIHKPFRNGFVEYVIQTGKIVNVNDPYSHPMLKELKEVAKFNQVHADSFLMVPITNREGKTNGCLQVINKRSGEFDQKDTNYLCVMAEFISLAIQNALTNADVQECRRLEEEVQRAVEIQRQLLPKKVPAIPDYEMFVFNQPCKYVGGDYYDFFPFPRSMSFVLADVSGKGIPAALLSANLHASLHAFASEINSCKEVVKKVNNHFYLYTSADMFATFFWGNLNYHSHTFRYVNAGHIPPVIIRSDGSVEKLKSGGLPIGIMDSFEFEEAEMIFQPGDTLIMFSDGLIENRNHENQLFGKSRLMELIQRASIRAPKELGKNILHELRN
ncbi:MAG: GAF domain-containing protein, partial [Calditrichaeota bacterium]